MFAWPALWVRYVYSKKISLVHLPDRFGMLSVTIDFSESHITYRTVWMVQLFSIVTLVALLLVTSAGLPGTQ